MTIEEAAKYLNTSIPSIRNSIKIGKLPSYQDGLIVMLMQRDLDAFLKLS